MNCTNKIMFRIAFGNYGVSPWAISPKAVEIVRETPKMVFFIVRNFGKNLERGELKESAGYKFYDTWEEARDALAAHQGKYVEQCRKHLAEGESILSKIKALVPGDGKEA